MTAFTDPTTVEDRWVDGLVADAVPRTVGVAFQVLRPGGRVIVPEPAKKIVGEWIGHEFDPGSSSATEVAPVTGHEHDSSNSTEQGVG